MGTVIGVPVNGWSMYPLFVPGRDMAVITPFRETLAVPAEEGLPSLPSAADVKRGDVVLFRRKGGMLVLHRVFRVRKEEYSFVGDNMPQIEKGIRREQLVGLLTGFIRNGTKISVKDPLYRTLSGLWLCLRPFRPFIHAVSRAGKKKQS